ncbi:MAG: DUF370 domain-containing protein [Clostridiales bacterium]|jgi:hypothetical protein|nr:DUF370 domain-containing protein [Clostridiales bacterium]
MYLHLGGQVVVPYDSVIGIFDIDNTTLSKHTRNYLTKAQNEQRVVNVSEDLPRSFVVCEKHRETTVYISQISPHTLLRRVEENEYAK